MVMGDHLVRLEKVSADSWDGHEDNNIDVRAVLASGRTIIFTVFTPRNILRLMNDDPDAKSFVCPGMLIVRRIDEDCLRDAVESWLTQEYTG